MNKKSRSKLEYLAFCLICKLYKKRGKYSFIIDLPYDHLRYLDVGCGNNSPKNTKWINPKVYYIGIDVQDYNNDSTSVDMANEYIITDSKHFHEKIECFSNSIDVVVSNHNLEHCEYPKLVLKSMCKSLKHHGKMFLAFPCEESVAFPSRKGTLNFFDDSSHSKVPNWKETILTLKRNNMNIIYCKKHYRPFLSTVIGAIMEIFIKDHITKFTWPYWGFESIIWAEKK